VHPGLDISFASLQALRPVRKNIVLSNAVGAKKMTGISGDLVDDPQAWKTRLY